MPFPVYYINAFTDTLFHGNPAAVCILPKWLEDEALLAIARENNLPVTAFLVRNKNKPDDGYAIRWITPEYELDLCGHGSLSAGFVVFNYLEPNLEQVVFQSASGLLSLSRQNNFIELDFPAKSIEKTASSILEAGLGLPPKAVYQYKNERYLAIYATEKEITQLKPSMESLKNLEHRGITVSAKGETVDFVSRTFYPNKSISEDPVTGASHCLLVPYWSKILNKKNLHARQLSERQGELFCRYENNRVLLKGQAVLYLQGVIDLA